MAAVEDFRKGNEAEEAENYSEAVECYNRAVTAEPSQDQYLSRRAHVHIKLENYIDAVADATKAVQLNPLSSDAFLAKGTASYYLEEFESAKAAFTEGKQLPTSDKENFASWIEKCDARLKSEQASNTGGDSIQNTSISTAAAAGTVDAPKPSDVAMPNKTRAKFDWYQTETHVVLTVMLKGVQKEQLKTNVQEKSLSVTVKQPSGTDYSLELDLAHAIDPDHSTIKILSTKVEIKLKKVEGLRWPMLEGDHEAADVKQFKPDSLKTAETAPKYPSSAHFTRDWDKVVADIKKEEKDEKLEGDAALNNLFQQIYSDGSDEVRKAMNKSFTESGGTVLSTNWKDIAAKPTEVKPPDGMEYKTWEH